MQKQKWNLLNINKSAALCCVHVFPAALCSTVETRSHIETSLFLIVVCERLHSLLVRVLVIRILSVVTVINLDPCLKLCLHGN